MAGAAIVLSYVLTDIDARLGSETVREFGWLYSFGPEGARAILSAVASSMITVAGLTFSITMLTLQLASSQFGPRLLRNFMRDRGNQIVLGTFIATFAYCLLVLRTVRGTEESSFVPHLSVAFGVGLALASLGVLIFFIHHVATAIRIEYVLADLAAEARAAVDRLYPEELGRGAPSPSAADVRRLVPADLDSNARPVSAGESGYVQRIDVQALMRVATERDVLVRIDARPGRFVTEHDTLLSAYPRERVPDEVADELRGALIVGPDRTPQQDLEFSIRRIVEVAQRALSPGVNDPTTALYCIDRLGEALKRLASRDTPSPMRFDGSGQPRVLTEVASLQEIAYPTFAAVARYGMTDADVVARLLATMDALIRAARPEARTILAELGEAIRRESQNQASLEFDRQAVREPE